MDITQLPMAIRAAYFTLHRETDHRFSELGVTADQFVLLATLRVARKTGPRRSCSPSERCQGKICKLDRQRPKEIRSTLGSE